MLTLLVAQAAMAAAYAAPQQQARDPRLVIDATRAGQRLVAVGEWGAIRISDDRGANWQSVRTPTEETLTAVQFLDASRGWAVGHHGTVLASSDGGRSWALLSPEPPSPETLLGVSFLDVNNGFVVGSFGTLLHSADGRHFVPRDIGQGDRHLKAVNSHASGRVVIASEEGAVFCSADRGATFKLSNTGYRGSFWGALALPGGALVYGMRGTVYRSDDDCRSWTQLTTRTQAGLSAAAQLSPQNIVLAGADGAVLESRNGGRSFEAVQRADRSGIHAAVPLDGERVLLLGRGAPVVHTLSEIKQ